MNTSNAGRQIQAQKYIRHKLNHVNLAYSIYVCFGTRLIRPIDFSQFEN